MIKYLATLLLVMLPYGVQAHDTTRADGTGICHQHSGGPATSPDDVRRMIDSALDVWDSGTVIRVHIVNDTTLRPIVWMSLNPQPIPDSVMRIDTIRSLDTGYMKAKP